MYRCVLFTYAPAFLCLCTSVIMAAPDVDQPDPATDASHATAASTAPAPLEPDSSGIIKNRFISFSNPEEGWTAIRITFVSLHHVDPPYTGGPSIPFTLFEGLSQYVGPPTRYVESLSNGTPFHASSLQCDPYYHDWSTVELLHVSGEAIVPSSIYDVHTLAASCLDHEEQCAAVSPVLTVETSRWGDIVESSGAPGSGGQADFSDISALVNKFKNADDAPLKSHAMLVSDGDRGLIDPRPEVSFSHIAAGVAAFKGLPYPHKPGMCSNNSTRACISDEECSEGQPPGLCVLCGSVSGGACCHGDGTCDILPESACNGPNDTYKGDETPCSRCCGPSPGCAPLTNAEWLDVQLLWPYLDRRDICKEAEETPTYNCVGWAVNSTDQWIWDEVDMDGDWLFETWEFEDFFAQHQKSAIIYGVNSEAIHHTARPLPNNCASSKAGAWIRLRHDRNQIEGGYYGNILDAYEY